MTINERIKAVIEDAGISQKKLAEQLDKPESTIHYILNGNRKVKVDFVIDILEWNPNINMEWLIMGAGSRYKDDTNIVMEPVEKSEEEKLYDIRFLIETVKRLSDRIDDLEEKTKLQENLKRIHKERNAS